MTKILKKDCEIHKGYIQSNGYGKSGKSYAHREAYVETYGEIPDGLEIDHLCRTRSCVNPQHLEAVTHQENMARSLPAQKTHCINGHEFTPENTYRDPRHQQRYCRVCNADAQRRWVRRLKASAEGGNWGGYWAY